MPTPEVIRQLAIGLRVTADDLLFVIAFGRSAGGAQRLASCLGSIPSSRKDRGLTQQTLADRSGIHVTLLRRYEAGQTRPGFDALRRVAVALNASADKLVFEEGEHSPSDDLIRLFEAAGRLDDHEREVLRTTIEGVLLRSPGARASRARTSPGRRPPGPPSSAPPPAARKEARHGRPS